MKIEAICAVCGRKEEIEIDDETGKILSDWFYFGKVATEDGYVEYWECPVCYLEKANEKNIEVNGNTIIIPHDLKEGIWSFQFRGQEMIVMKTKEYIKIYEVIDNESH